MSLFQLWEHIVQKMMKFQWLCKHKYSDMRRFLESGMKYKGSRP